MSKDKTLILLGSVFTIAGALIVSLLSIAASISESISVIRDGLIFSRFVFMGYGVIILYPLFFIGLIMFVAGLIMLIKELLSVTGGKIRKAIYRILAYDGHKKDSESMSNTDNKIDNTDNK